MTQLRVFKRILQRVQGAKPAASLVDSKEVLINKYLHSGRVPWSEGYEEYKWDMIEKSISDPNIVEIFKLGNLPIGYGIGIDERVVEYPWIISGLSVSPTVLLDAGSTFNYRVILDHTLVSKKELSILTYFPEHENFNMRRISYAYADLRKMPYRDSLFDEVVCHSTIEHIDMDNSIYGYQIKESSSQPTKSYEYLTAIDELVRVLKNKGVLLLTFPYGIYENHGFFQQFDNEMLERINLLLGECGNITHSFFRYFKDGWKNVSQSSADKAQSYNPHTGKGKMDDGAAHCRAVCCIKFVKE